MLVLLFLSNLAGVVEDLNDLYQEALDPSSCTSAVRQIFPKGIIKTQRYDNGSAIGRYSFQRRDDHVEVGGGRINGAGKALFASDLNSVITESRNLRAANSMN